MYFKCYTNLKTWNTYQTFFTHRRHNDEYCVLTTQLQLKEEVMCLLSGKGCEAIEEGRAFGVQSLSGTGSIRVGAEFLQKQLGAITVYVSEPTWGNHNLIFKYAGYSQIKKYRYWNAGTKT